MKKGEGITDLVEPKSYFLLFVENYNSHPQLEFGDQIVVDQKLKLADEFRRLLLEWTFPRNKSKIKRVWTTEIQPTQASERQFNQ